MLKHDSSLSTFLFKPIVGSVCMRRFRKDCARKCSPLLPSSQPVFPLINVWLTHLFSSLLSLCSFTAFPFFSGMFCLVGCLQDGIEDTEMFYILQMACDHNCTAEGICWDLLIACAVLRDHLHCLLVLPAGCGWLVLCYGIGVVPHFFPQNLRPD